MILHTFLDIILDLTSSCTHVLLQHVRLAVMNACRGWCVGYLPQLAGEEVWCLSFHPACVRSVRQHKLTGCVCVYDMIFFVTCRLLGWRRWPRGQSLIVTRLAMCGSRLDRVSACQLRHGWDVLLWCGEDRSSNIATASLPIAEYRITHS